MFAESSICLVIQLACTLFIYRLHLFASHSALHKKAVFNAEFGARTNHSLVVYTRLSSVLKYPQEVDAKARSHIGNISKPGLSLMAVVSITASPFQMYCLF